MPPKYKLTYFDARGRAEITRLLFAQGGVEYEDNRISHEQFVKTKDSFPNGQLPILEVDGVTIAQTMAMARLVAKRTGMAGKTDLDQARVDMIVDSLVDCWQPIVNIILSGGNEEEKAAAKKKYMEETFDQSFAKIEKMLCQNKGGDGFFVGDSVTMADFVFVVISDYVKWVSEGMPYLPKMPKLKALEKRVTSLPRVAQWIEKRPKTQF